MLPLFSQLSILYYSLIFSCFILAILRFRYVDMATKFILISVFVAVVVEVFARNMAINYGSNLVLYNLFGLVDLICSLFYFKSIGVNKNFKRLIFSIGILTLMWWIYNMFYLNMFDSVMNNYILLQCIVVISLSLYTIYERLSILNKKGFKNIHLFLPFILMFNQVGALVHWLFFDYFLNIYPSELIVLSIGILSTSIVYYFNLFLVLLFHTRLNKKVLLPI